MTSKLSAILEKYYPKRDMVKYWSAKEYISIDYDGWASSLAASLSVYIERCFVEGYKENIMDEIAEEISLFLDRAIEVDDDECKIIHNRWILDAYLSDTKNEELVRNVRDKDFRKFADSGKCKCRWEDIYTCCFCKNACCENAKVHDCVCRLAFSCQEHQPYVKCIGTHS